jgi:hypothetical protein
MNCPFMPSTAAPSKACYAHNWRMHCDFLPLARARNMGRNIGRVLRLNASPRTQTVEIGHCGAAEPAAVATRALLIAFD